LCGRSSQRTDKTGENTLLQQNTALTELFHYYRHYLHPLFPDHKPLPQNQNMTINPLACKHLKSISETTKMQKRYMKTDRNFSNIYFVILHSSMIISTIIKEINIPLQKL
jgi:hypothetical protein